MKSFFITFILVFLLSSVTLALTPYPPETPFTLCEDNCNDNCKKYNVYDGDLIPSDEYQNCYVTCLQEVCAPLDYCEAENFLCVKQRYWKGIFPGEDCLGEYWQCRNLEGGDSNPCDNGCYIKRETYWECVPFGTRLTYKNIPSYCALDGTLRKQKIDGEAADHDYECISNSARYGQCENVKEQTGFLHKIFTWLARLFGGNT